MEPPARSDFFPVKRTGSAQSSHSLFLPNEFKRMLPSIKIHNGQRAVRIDLEKLQSFARRALVLAAKARSRASKAFSKLPDIDVNLISDRRMTQLHRRFLKIEGPTDVITFQHGEIFISVETAGRHARAFGTSLEKEIQLYLVHGLLHLRGFDDKTPSTARVMRETQNRVVRAARKM
jgi:probable rRNA maturation factor